MMCTLNWQREWLLLGGGDTFVSVLNFCFYSKHMFFSSGERFKSYKCKERQMSGSAPREPRNALRDARGGASEQGSSCSPHSKDWLTSQLVN